MNLGKWNYGISMHIAWPVLKACSVFFNQCGPGQCDFYSLIRVNRDMLWIFPDDL